MTSYRPGDLVLLAFPYVGGTQTKQRPALVILDPGDADVVVARVTTQRYQTAFDVTLADWHGAGLLAPSVVRVHKVATLEKSLVRAQLGRVLAEDRRRIGEVLRRTYGRRWASE
jgi:mRNA interferase MazF